MKRFVRVRHLPGSPRHFAVAMGPAPCRLMDAPREHPRQMSDSASASRLPALRCGPGRPDFSPSGLGP